MHFGGHVIVFFVVHIFIICVRPLSSLTFTVPLSSQLAHKYRGQLLAYFTFIDDGHSSLIFKKSVELDPSARLYLIPVGSQRYFIANSESSCANFYSSAISSVLLNRTGSNLSLGSFTGYFPTFLAYADDLTCKITVAPIRTKTKSLVEITLLNPDNQTLSGSLTGLRKHTLGLCFAYLAALIYTLYSAYLQGCCESTTISTSSSMGGGSHAFDPDSNSFLSDFVMQPEKSFCSRLRKNARRSIASGGSKGSGIVCLTALLIFQLISLIGFYTEVSRLANSKPGSPVSHHSVAGADGFYGHVSELLAIVAHFLMLNLLLTECLAVMAKTQSDSTANSSTTPAAADYPLQPCCEDALDICPSAKNCNLYSVPTYSIFVFFRPAFLNRLLWILFMSQVSWYLFREGIYPELGSVEPDRWPMEEQHAFWGGWGLPNSNYLDQSQSAGVVIKKPSILSLSSSSFLSLSFLLTSVRSVVGLVLSARLVSISKLPTIRAAQSLELHHVGVMGILWFIAHPSFSLLGILFADHIRYKILLVGVTTVQVCVCGGLVYRYSRQHLLWDISSLASSLPHLRRIPPSGVRL